MENIENKSIEERLEYYRNHPVYGKCYEAVVQNISNITFRSSEPVWLEDYVAIFDEADELVNEVIGSAFPEIEIGNVLTRINKRYGIGEDVVNNLPRSRFQGNQMIGICVEMIFLILICDQYENMPDVCRRTLMYHRARIEYINADLHYLTNEMWLLVAERIPRMENPRVEDLRARIAELEKQLQDKKMNMLEKEKDTQKIALSLCHKMLDILIKGSVTESEKSQMIEYMTGWKASSIRPILSTLQKESLPGVYKNKVEEINDALNNMGIDIKLSTK